MYKPAPYIIITNNVGGWFFLASLCIQRNPEYKNMNFFFSPAWHTFSIVSDFNQLLMHMITDQVAFDTFKKRLYILFPVYGLNANIIFFQEHRARIFAAILEMLRWFAGPQVRNVAVSEF